MGILIDFKTRKPIEATPQTGPNRLRPDVDNLLKRHYKQRGDAAILAGTVIQLLDTLDLICMTAECTAIEAGVYNQNDHPYNVIGAMCRDILDSPQHGQ